MVAPEVFCGSSSSWKDGPEPVNRNESSWALGPPTQHENQLPFAGRGSGNVALSWYERVRNESDVGAFGTPHCRVRARRAESCVEGSSSGSRPHFWQEGGVMDQLIER